LHCNDCCPIRACKRSNSGSAAAGTAVPPRMHVLAQTAAWTDTAHCTSSWLTYHRTAIWESASCDHGCVLHPPAPRGRFKTGSPSSCPTPLIIQSGPALMAGNPLKSLANTLAPASNASSDADPQQQRPISVNTSGPDSTLVGRFLEEEDGSYLFEWPLSTIRRGLSLKLPVEQCWDLRKAMWLTAGPVWLGARLQHCIRGKVSSLHQATMRVLPPCS